MFKDLLQGILSVIAIKILDNYRKLSIQLLKIEAARSYLRAVQMARTSSIGVMRILMFMALVFAGVLMLHISIFVLLPLTVKAKAVICLFLGLFYVSIGLLALWAAIDEKAWMDKSGASKMLEEATGRQ